jgi:hypothetical protein
MKAMVPAAWRGFQAEVGILEGDAAFGGHAEPARRLEIDVGMRLGAFDVVSRRQRGKAAEQARLAEMVLGRGAPGRGCDAKRQAAARQEVEQLHDAGLHRNARVHAPARVHRELLAKRVDAEAFAVMRFDHAVALGTRHAGRGMAEIER